MDLALEMIGITKRYPGVTACNSVDLKVEKGSIHALVGENGAGKTTLMKVLYGLEQPDEGRILVMGKETRIDGVDKAIDLGIGMVHQHFMLVKDLSVAENIVLGREPRKGFRFDKQRAIQEIEDLARGNGFNLDASRLVSQCPVGIQQSAEILKALYRKARILILDEPTAVLTPQESRQLFSTLKSLSQNGVTIIFITHKLSEVMEVSDRITVLRTGRVTGNLITKETNPREIARLMVGREVFLKRKESTAKPGDVVLEVDSLVVGEGAHHLVDGVSLEVRAGEILGIAGVAGNGQSELLEAIAGLRYVASGSVRVDGRDITNQGVARARRAGVAHIPEDRFKRGLAVDATVGENAIMGRQSQAPLSRGGLMQATEVRRSAEEIASAFAVKMTSSDQVASSLSGGNLQKLILGRELTLSPKVILAGQPTRGVDIGATEFIHSEIRRIADMGAGVLLVSAELSEILVLSDRILVMFNGGIAGQRFPDKTSEEDLGLLMAGFRHDGGDTL